MTAFDFLTQKGQMTRTRSVALVLILVVDLGMVAWGVMAAAWPDHLLGPHGVPILTAGYEGFTKASWAELVATSPMTAKYIGVLFRLYGMYCVVFGLMATAVAVTAFRRGDRWAWWTLLAGNTIALGSAMTYDWIVSAIGPFELTEYLGVVAVYGALTITAPFRSSDLRVATVSPTRERPL